MVPGTTQRDWMRAIVILTATVVFLTVVAALYWARTIFLPIALAIYVSFVLGPVVARLQRLGLGRGPAVILTVTLAVATTALVTLLITQQIAGLAETLPDRAQNIKDKLMSVKKMVVPDGPSRFGKMIDDLSEVIGTAPPPPVDQPTPTVIVPQSPSWMSQLEALVSPLVEMLAQGAFAFILAVFMLLKKADLRNRVVRLIGHGRVTTTTKAIDDASKRISRYLLMQLIINSACGLVISLVLFAIGVQYALLWGFIAFLMRYVPYLGTWIGLIPPVVFSLAMSEGWWQPLTVLATFLIVEAICNNIFEPWLFGKSMGLSEVAQLVAAGFWTFLWGPVGLILSGPLTVCLLVLGRYVPRFEFLAVLLGDEEALEPRLAFYQRLAARDQDEAASVAQERAKLTSRDAVYDDLFIPALSLAKGDLEERELSPSDVEFITAAVLETAEDVEESEAPEKAVESDVEVRKVRVLACPARDQLDRAAVELFALSLDPRKWEVQVTAVETLTSELLRQVEEEQPAVVCIGSLPPGGLAHTRYLCKRLRAKFPALKIVVGRWGQTVEAKDAKDGESEPFAVAGADEVDLTLAETKQILQSWHPVLSASSAENARKPADAASRRLVGTPSA
jgi:predicted PurR-regulated permease PerM